MSDIDVTEMGDAGKARPVPRGRYSDTETYDYLDFVYSGDASYIAKKLTTGNPPAENNEYWQLFARGGTLTENSDVSDTTVTFEQAENRANIFSKDSLKTIMGKISKMYSDLKTVAFSGKYTDLEGRVTVTNNDLATIPGTAWDAVRGAQIRKDLDKLNSDFKTYELIATLEKDYDWTYFYDKKLTDYRFIVFAILNNKSLRYLNMVPSVFLHESTIQLTYCITTSTQDEYVLYACNPYFAMYTKRLSREGTHAVIYGIK